MTTTSHVKLRAAIVLLPGVRKNPYWDLADKFRAVWGDGDVPITLKSLTAGLPVHRMGWRFKFEDLARFVVPSSRWFVYKAAEVTSYAEYARLRETAWRNLSQMMWREWRERVVGGQLTVGGYNGLREDWWSDYYQTIHAAYDLHRSNVVAAIVEAANMTDAANHLYMAGAPAVYRRSITPIPFTRVYL